MPVQDWDADQFEAGAEMMRQLNFALNAAFSKDPITVDQFLQEHILGFVCDDKEIEADEALNRISVMTDFVEWLAMKGD